MEIVNESSNTKVSNDINNSKVEHNDKFVEIAAATTKEAQPSTLENFGDWASRFVKNLLPAITVVGEKWVCKISSISSIDGEVQHINRMELDFDSKESAEAYAYHKWIQWEDCHNFEDEFEVLVCKKGDTQNTKPSLRFSSKEPQLKVIEQKENFDDWVILGY